MLATRHSRSAMLQDHISPHDCSNHHVYRRPEADGKCIVQFDLFLQTREIMRRGDYTEKERRKCWYSPDEKQKNEECRSKILVRMEAGKPPKRSMTYRGLFFLTEQGERELDRNIPKCIDAVMDEQEGQWKAREDDWDRLAAVSARVTRESAEEAFEIAKQDKMDAELAWEEDDNNNIVSEDELGCSFSSLIFIVLEES